MDMTTVERAITTRTKAILPVHLYGQCAEMEALQRIASRHGVAIADWPADPIDPFFNVNTPEDAAKAEHIALQHTGG